MELFKGVNLRRPVYLNDVWTSDRYPGRGCRASGPRGGGADARLTSTVPAGTPARRFDQRDVLDVDSRFTVAIPATGRSVPGESPGVRLALPRGRDDSTLTARLYGIGWMAVSVAGLTAQGAIVKHLSDEFSSPMLLLFRSVFIIALVLPFALWRGRRSWRPSNLGSHFARSLYGFGTLMCYLYAIAMLPLADAIALSFTRPIWAIIIAAIVLKEALTGRRVGATVLGFIGILFIAGPQGAFQPATLVALLGAVFAGFSIIAIKQLASVEPIEKIILYFALFTGALSIVPAAFSWTMPDAPFEILMLFAASVAALVGQLGMALAARRAPISTIVPMDFMRVPAAAVAGFLFFSETPTIGLLVGTAIVLLSTFLAVSDGRRCLRARNGLRR